MCACARVRVCVCVHGNLQSRCFFLGPLTSCVVALQAALLMAEPVMLCCAAAIRSVRVWPDMSPHRAKGEEPRAPGKKKKAA